MATVKFVSYRGGSSHISRTNDYLADGHGDDPLDRTNRYITGSHARGARCVGVNCPSDPALASALMASLRAAYEAGRRGRRTRGTGGKNVPSSIIKSCCPGTPVRKSPRRSGTRWAGS